MLLGNILWDTDFPKIGCKGSENFLYMQEIHKKYSLKRIFFGLE